MAISPLLQNLLKQGNKGLDAADSFLTSPGGNFALNLLAQQGFSTMPQSPLGAIGRAGLATADQQRQNRRGNLEDRLLKARIGLTEAQTQNVGLNDANNNVARTFEGQNGNMWIIRRSGGPPEDTGVPFSNNLQFIEAEDGSVRAFNRQTGQEMGTLVSPEEAADARTRSLQTDAAQELPTALAGLDAQISNLNLTIDKIDDIIPLVRPGTTGAGSLRSGLPGNLGGGDARTLARAIQSLQANLGFDTLQRMRAASQTGGALGQVSERELDLLINALQALDQGGDDEVLIENLRAVQTHYRNYVREIEIMKNKLREQAGQATVPLSDSGAGDELTPAEREELRRREAIARGGS